MGLEEVDNGRDLNDLVLPRDASRWEQGLYQARPTPLRRVAIQAVPYAVWGNRRGGEMVVWIRDLRG